MTDLEGIEDELLFDDAAEPHGSAVAPGEIHDRLLGHHHHHREQSPRRRMPSEEEPEERLLRDTPPGSPSINGPRRFEFSGEAATEAGEELQMYQPHPYETYVFPLTDKERARPQDAGWCFLCDRGQTAEDAQRNPRVTELKSYLYNNYHDTDPVTLTTKAQEMYANLGIMHYAGGRLWFRSMIYMHITQHHPSPRIITEDSIRTLNHVRICLRDNGLFLKNTVGRPTDIKIDKLALTMYLNVQKEIKALLREADVMRSNASITSGRPGG